MTENAESLVANYLARVEQASEDLSSHTRADLLRDLREHIQNAREEHLLETAAQVNEILDRLGDPEIIAAVARGDSTRRASGGHSEEGKKRMLLRNIIIVSALVVVGIAVILVIFFATTSSSGASGRASMSTSPGAYHLLGQERANADSS